MNHFVADWLAKNAIGSWSNELPQSTVTSFSIDTRSLEEGALFIAIKTDKRDGHDYLQQAKDAGATAALVSHFRPDVSLPQLEVEDTIEALHRLAKSHRESTTNHVVGITGSCGKTSTKEMLRLLLGNKAYVTPNNLNNLLGVPLSILSWDYNENPIGVFEAGISEEGEMSKLAEMIQPTIGVITAIGESHLEGLETTENVAIQKNFLQENVLEGGMRFYPEEMLAYLEINSYQFENVFIIKTEELSGTQHVHYSFRQLKLNDQEDSLRVTISRSGVHLKYDIPDMSAGMLRNAVFAILVAEEFGIERETIQERFLQWQPFEKRGEEFLLGDCLIYFDSYNANPLSLIDAATYFRSHYAMASKLYIVGELAELGQSSNEIHRQVGAKLPVVKEDHIIFIGGDDALAMKEAVEKKCHVFRSEYFSPSQMNEVRKRISYHQGAVFIKGSRSLKLEQLLPERVSVC